MLIFNLVLDGLILIAGGFVLVNGVMLLVEIHRFRRDFLKQ